MSHPTVVIVVSFSFSAGAWPRDLDADKCPCSVMSVYLFHLFRHFTTRPPLHLQLPVLISDGIPALVELLSLDGEDVQSVAVSVLCNISEHDPVRRALSAAYAGPVLIHLLSSASDEVQSRAAIVISDVACVDNNRSGKCS